MQPDWDEWNSETWAERRERYRWYFNFIVFGVPYMGLDILFQVINVWQNITNNKMWAGGNWWLMYNTFVSFFQGICSFLLVAEFPVYILGSKALRAFSFGVAFIYDLFWFFGLLVFLHYNWEAHAQNVHAGGDPASMFTTIELLVDLFFAFHLIWNAPIAFMNFIILVKEYAIERREGNHELMWHG